MRRIPGAAVAAAVVLAARCAAETVTPIAKDFDGDGRADPALVVDGDWYAWLSGSNYRPALLPEQQSTSGGSLAGGDIDGDGRIDGGMAAGKFGAYWLSSQGFGMNFADLGQSGSIILDDINRDGKDDLFLTTADSKIFYYSSKRNWQQPTAPIDMIRLEMGPGRLITGNFNGDSIRDIGWVSGGTWTLFLARPEWADNPKFELIFYVFGQRQTLALDTAGQPFLPDFDGDGRGDPTVYVESTRQWWVWLSSGGYAKHGPYEFTTGLPALAGAAVLQDDEGALAIADITDGVLDITDADLSVNGVRLRYGMPLRFPIAGRHTFNALLPFYYARLGTIAAATPMSFRAVRSNGEAVFQSPEYPMPGRVRLLKPDQPLPIMQGQDVPMEWTPVEGADGSLASYLALDEETESEDQGCVARFLPHPESAVTVPASVILPGLAEFAVTALTGDYAELLAGQAPTRSFFIVGTSAQYHNYINTPSPPGALRIAREYDEKHEGFRCTIRESDPLQVWTPGTISVNVKMRRFKASVAAVQAYDPNGTLYFQWEKARIFSSRNRKYLVSFAAVPYTTVAIVTHDASFRGGSYNY